ncbi:flagellar protein FliT [Metabacillus sp. FJAT-52054]|uniref:Flagellar protein FliT n=1 Tax=Metabacillus sediminis TaxID=3117746 RepID=A0ABZ2NFK5_9BACI
MSSVFEVHTLTAQLLNLLDQPAKQDERETLIGQIDNKLNEREAAMKQIAAPFTDREKEQLHEINEWNKEIVEKMSIVKTIIQADMQRLKKTKDGANKYVNPYQSVQADGMFYDKRK